MIASSTACVYGGTVAIANERRYGTLGAVLLSPRRRAPLWFGRALPYVLNGLLISIFTLTAASLLLGSADSARGGARPGRRPAGGVRGLGPRAPRGGARGRGGAGYALLAVALLAAFERGSRRPATLDVM
ncbi:hypothetical protein [Streptomyces sp. NPDC060022]|uniref:hypothetical protein n=1 Tax=Streptomyces sp. NPDC060022 TaxID=3347039 RepID=UPI0036BEEDAE